MNLLTRLCLYGRQVHRLAMTNVCLLNINYYTLKCSNSLLIIIESYNNNLSFYKAKILRTKFNIYLKEML